MNMHKYFWYSIGGVILGTTITITGFAKNYYETGNIPGIVPLEGYNKAIALTGTAIIAASGIIPLALDLRDRRKRKQALESTLEDSPPQTFANRISDDNANLPFLP